MDKNQQLELDIADTIIDRPKGFSVGSRHFYLYPMSLGKVFLEKRVVNSLNVSTDLLQANPYMEAFRLAEEKKEECCLLISYHTLRTKKEVLNNNLVASRKNFFLKKMGNEDIATLTLACLTHDKTSTLIQHFEIDKELERMSEVAKVKDGTNTFCFGGKSIYGALIDVVCERYKWTFDYVLWEISYINLQMLIKDKVTSLYLTDEEMKKVHINNLSEMVDGNDGKALIDALQSTDWK